MSKFSESEEGKIRSVIKYLASNYDLETFRGDLQKERVVLFIELLNGKHGLVSYDKEEVVSIIETEEGVHIKERESVYGNKYVYIGEKEKYEGDSFKEEEKEIIDKEIDYTKSMSFDSFRNYVYHEVNK